MIEDVKNSAQRYLSIIDNTIDGILMLNSIKDTQGNIVDFRIQHCNAMGCKLAKFPENASGKTLLEVLPHLLANRQFEMHKQVVETGEPIQFETTFRNEKGEEFGWFIVTLQKLDDGVLSRFVDITEKKKYEDQIERQASLLNSVLEASQHSVVALKASKEKDELITDFIFVMVNNRFANMLGLSEMELKGRSYNEFLKEIGQHGMFDIKCEVIRTGVPYEGEVFYNYNEKESWFNVSITKLGTDGVVQTIVDITESKKAEKRLSKIINTSGAGVITLQPIMDDSGQLADFKFGMVNDAMRQFLKIGSSCLSEKPVSVYFSFFNNTRLSDTLWKAYKSSVT